MQAVWRNTVIAESDETIVIEGNHYFPPESIHREYLQASETRTRCPWKGEATYFHLTSGDRINPDAAWTYLQPSVAASQIKDYVAFWKGVVVIPSPSS